MPRRQAVVGSLEWIEDWCNAACPQGAAECSRIEEVRARQGGPENFTSAGAECAAALRGGSCASVLCPSAVRLPGAPPASLSLCTHPSWSALTLLASLQVLEEGFEYVQPDGTVQSRREFLGWLATQGYGSKVPVSTTSAAGGSGAGGGTAVPASGGGGGRAGASNSDSCRARMWVDGWSERELAPGVWLARYMELHQPFVGTLLGMAEGRQFYRWCAVRCSCRRAVFLDCGRRAGRSWPGLCSWAAVGVLSSCTLCLPQAHNPHPYPPPLLPTHSRPPPPKQIPPPHTGAAGEHTGQLRSGRVATAVLRQAGGAVEVEGSSSWRIAFIQETYVPQEAARG